MLQVLAHSNLTHEFVLVPVHSRQLPNMSKRILQPIRKLVRIHIPKPVLDMRVNNDFRKPENLSKEMERISKAGLFTLFCRQCFDGFKVEIVVQVEVVQVLSMNE